MSCLHLCDRNTRILLATYQKLIDAVKKNTVKLLIYKYLEATVYFQYKFSTVSAESIHMNPHPPPLK